MTMIRLGERGLVLGKYRNLNTENDQTLSLLSGKVLI